ncbi:MAG TPA: enoyl-CoA hydratase/isomerase family protein [Burkholderiales bacterium]|nr:enoyl-CoA hydratase/isomerase family protein [Burkholderiales bacterium]
MSELALREDIDGVAIVTWNRPDKLNAINEEMLAVLRQAIEDLRDRDEVRVLLIRGQGRFFTAGMDISGKRTMVDPKKLMMNVRRDYRIPLHMLFDEMEAIEKPVVMAIHGVCLGVGVEMGGACDLRVAAESARFGLPEVDIGVIAGSGGTSRFTRLCGPGFAKWLGMGEQIDARTAMAAGFVQAIWPDATFQDEALALCKRLADRPADVLGAVKVAVDLCKDLDRQSGRIVERVLNTPLMMRDNSALVEKVLGRKKKK